MYVVFKLPLVPELKAEWTKVVEALKIKRRQTRCQLPHAAFGLRRTTPYYQYAQHPLVVAPPT